MILKKEDPASTQVSTIIIHTSTTSEFVNVCFVRFRKACSFMHKPMLEKILLLERVK